MLLLRLIIGSLLIVFTWTFPKAFDKVPHQRLLVKLKTVGIEGKVLKRIRDWLSNRKQRVVLNDTNPSSSLY